MRRLVLAVLAAVLLDPSFAVAAEAKVLRRLAAPPPIQLQPLPPDATPRAVTLAKVAIHPADGEAWALAYDTFPLRGEGAPPPVKGIVSAARTYEGVSYIHSDVAVNGGNSGGPLIDEKGAVVGVTVSGYSVNGAPIGLNLFIPIADALRVLAIQTTQAP